MTSLPWAGGTGLSVYRGRLETLQRYSRTARAKALRQEQKAMSCHKLWEAELARTVTWGVKEEGGDRRGKPDCLGLCGPLEKEMTTHSNILAWEMPWTEEPGRLQSTRSQRVGHN